MSKVKNPNGCRYHWAAVMELKKNKEKTKQKAKNELREYLKGYR